MEDFAEEKMTLFSLFFLFPGGEEWDERGGRGRPGFPHHEHGGFLVVWMKELGTVNANAIMVFLISSIHRLMGLAACGDSTCYTYSLVAFRVKASQAPSFSLRQSRKVGVSATNDKPSEVTRSWDA